MSETCHNALSMSPKNRSLQPKTEVWNQQPNLETENRSLKPKTESWIRKPKFETENRSLKPKTESWNRKPNLETESRTLTPKTEFWKYNWTPIPMSTPMGRHRNLTDGTDVPRSSLALQDIWNCRQPVCVGEWWASSFFFVPVLDGNYFFFFRGRSDVSYYSDFERSACPFGVVIIRSSCSLVKKLAMHAVVKHT